LIGRLGSYRTGERRDYRNVPLKGFNLGRKLQVLNKKQCRHG